MLRYHEAGDGPPLVLLHGSGPGVSGWRNFGGNLGVFAQHFRTLALEFPGFFVGSAGDEEFAEDLRGAVLGGDADAAPVPGDIAAAEDQ